MSIIYKGFDFSQSRKVIAIKEYFPISFAERGDGGHISPRSGCDKSFYEGFASFQQEAEILKSLAHRHIVRCYGLVKKYGTIYMVTEFCGEESLEDLCSKSPLGEESARNVILPILDALETTHNQGIIHCDVSPSNIHLKSQDYPVLIDFGSARFLDDSRNSRRPPTLNPGYSAPEQHSQKLGEYKPWTDIYACAATLYQMTTGKRLPAADLRRDGDLVLPTDLTRNFSDAITRALSLDPDDRPSSVDEFRSDLKGHSRSPGATIYPLGPQGKRVQQFAREHIPHVLIVLTFLLVALYIYSARDPGPFPTQTKTDLLVNPSDYYILRDASVSIDDRYYDVVESILKDSLRTAEESNDGADYTSYAHFASWATNGTSHLQPAVRGDIIAESKGRLDQSPPSREFLLRTDFATLFRQTLAAIRVSRAGVKEKKRIAIVAIITDGVHDPFNNRKPCLDVTQDKSDFFDDGAKESFKALAGEPSVYTLIFLLGAPPECSGGIKAKWVELATRFSSSGQVKIVSLEGYAQNRDPQDETLLRDLGGVINAAMNEIRRAPFVTIRPAVTILPDEQRERFDNNGEFYVDYVLQSHLCDGMVNLNILQASLLNAKGSVATPLNLSNKSDFRVFSDGSLRNGEENKETLVFKVASNFKPDLNQDYQVHLTVRAETAGSVIVRTERDIKIEPNKKARVDREKTRRLFWVAMISLAIAAVFSVSLLTYWRHGLWARRSRLRRILRNTFIKPLRYWIRGFFLLGLLMLFSFGAMINSASISSFTWLVGVAVLIVLFLWSLELVKKKAMEQLSLIHVLLSCLDSIFAPFLAALLSILQLK